MHFDLSIITKAAIRTIRQIQLEIWKDVERNPQEAFEPALLGGRRKALLTVDLVAERNAARKLTERLRDYETLVVGEESLGDETLDLSSIDALVVLVDMVDGTDLLERGLGNWCSAMVFYYPPERAILGAFVGLPDDGVYFAMQNMDRPKKFEFHGQKLKDVRGPSQVRDLGHASICFYGQQFSHLNAVTANSKLQDRFVTVQDDFRKREQKPLTRIYNLAGNPMMLKVIDGHTRIDAVFEFAGQAPHDVVPGAYIAQKGGATFRILGDDRTLGESLLKPAHPDSRLRYVVAATEELGAQLAECVNPVAKTEGVSVVHQAAAIGPVSAPDATKFNL